MKHILTIIMYLSYTIVFSYNSITTIKIIGNKERIAAFQLYNNNKVLLKKLKNANNIQLNLKEPMRVKLLDTNFVEGKQPEYVFFYLDIGKHEVVIDIDKLIFSSKTSKLNQAFADEWNTKLYYDTLQDNCNSITCDSVSKAYHKALYNLYSVHPNSFLALTFVDFISNYYISTGITKEEVLFLYDSLGKNLHKYPTYQRVKQYIEKHVRNYTAPYSNDSLPKPLFIIKQ